MQLSLEMSTPQRAQRGTEISPVKDNDAPFVQYSAAVVRHGEQQPVHLSAPSNSRNPVLCSNYAVLPAESAEVSLECEKMQLMPLGL